MRSPAPEPRPALLALYWLGIQAVWGALLAISLQARSAELAGANAVAAYGVLAISGAVVAAIVQIAAGFASDRRRRSSRDRVAFYVLGGGAGSAGIVWFYLAPSFAAVVAAYAIVQFGLNVAMAAYQPVIPDVGDHATTGVASSWMAGFQSLGNAIGAIVAAKVGDARIVAATIVALLLATLAATSAHVARLPLNPPVDDAPVATARGAFATLFGSRLLVYVGFFTLLGYLYFYVAVSAPPGSTIADHRATSGLMVLAFTVAGAIGAALAAGPSDRADKRVVASAGCAGVILALIALVVVRGGYLAFAATAFAGASWGVFLVADWALACRVLPRYALATSMAAWNLAIVVPQILAPLFTGLVLAFFHVAADRIPSAAFSLACIELVLGIFWLLRLPGGVARNNAPGVLC